MSAQPTSTSAATERSPSPPPAISFLRRWANWQKNTRDSSRLALGTLTVQDTAGNFSIVCTGITLQKVPDRVFDRTATNLVYTLLATTITEQ